MTFSHLNVEDEGIKSLLNHKFPKNGLDLLLNQAEVVGGRYFAPQGAFGKAWRHFWLPQWKETALLAPRV